MLSLLVVVCAALALAPAAAQELSAAGAAAGAARAPAARIVLPPGLPASCINQAAKDYAVPPEILVAIVKVESNGRQVIGHNRNGSRDYGVAQINSASWAPYLERRYGITADALISSPCQGMRAQAYVVRKEMNSRECAGTDIWCAVGRYHAPNNLMARSVYVPKVRRALHDMLSTGRFHAARPAHAIARAR